MEYLKLVEQYNKISKGQAFIDFSKSLVFTNTKFIGVSVTDIKKTAKDIAKNNPNIVNTYPLGIYHEIDFTVFLVTIYQNKPLREKLKDLWSLLPNLNNWAICDSACCAFKVKPYEYSILYDFIRKCIKTKKEFFVRFGVVLCLSNLINTEYIDKIFTLIESINCDKYYVNMAVAWLLSVCYIKFKDKTYNYMFVDKNNLSNEVIRMTIQKCTDSLRISLADKQILKELRNFYLNK